MSATIVADTHHGVCRRCGAKVTGIPRGYNNLLVFPTADAGRAAGAPCAHQQAGNLSPFTPVFDGRVAVGLDNAPRPL